MINHLKYTKKFIKYKSKRGKTQTESGASCNVSKMCSRSKWWHVKERKNTNCKSSWWQNWQSLSNEINNIALDYNPKYKINIQESILTSINDGTNKWERRNKPSFQTLFVGSTSSPPIWWLLTTPSQPLNVAGLRKLLQKSRIWKGGNNIILQ